MGEIKDTAKIATTLALIARNMQQGLKEDAVEVAKLPEGPKPKSDRGAKWDPHEDELLSDGGNE